MSLTCPLPRRGGPAGGAGGGQCGQLRRLAAAPKSKEGLQRGSEGFWEKVLLRQLGTFGCEDSLAEAAQWRRVHGRLPRLGNWVSCSASFRYVRVPLPSLPGFPLVLLAPTHVLWNSLLSRRSAHRDNSSSSVLTWEDTHKGGTDSELCIVESTGFPPVYLTNPCHHTYISKRGMDEASLHDWHRPRAKAVKTGRKGKRTLRGFRADVPGFRGMARCLVKWQRCGNSKLSWQWMANRVGRSLHGRRRTRPQPVHHISTLSDRLWSMRAATSSRVRQCVFAQRSIRTAE